ncbi:alpha-2B adrenergic receptor [Ambystoma mexicanum]|uniref:alpha-2B adrenergic receptor n=1 Tax=Ambystoma mexicanum TaxID=8296 RepID=UPI0037E79297
MFYRIELAPVSDLHPSFFPTFLWKDFCAVHFKTAMDSTDPYSVHGMAAVAAIITFIILFTIFGNILVIIAVLTSRSLKAPQNLFLVSLAAADILVATLIIPFSLANELMGYWPFEKTWCEIYLALDVLFCTSSIVHLCAISLDRYWSVSQAIEYNSKRTPRRIKCIILIVWTIAASISFPPLIFKGNKKELPGSKPQCKLNEETWYILSSSIGSFFAPCVIMILVYLRIYHIAKRRSKSPKKNKSRRVSEEDAPGGAHPQQMHRPSIQNHKGSPDPNGNRGSVQGKEPPNAPTISPVDKVTIAQPYGHQSIIKDSEHRDTSSSHLGQKIAVRPSAHDGTIQNEQQHRVVFPSPSGEQTTVQPNGHGGSIQTEDWHKVPSTSPTDPQTMVQPNGHGRSIQEEKQHNAPYTSPSGQQTIVQTNGSNLTMRTELQTVETERDQPGHVADQQAKESSVCRHCPPRTLETIAIVGGEVALVRGVPSPNVAKRKSHMNREKRFTFVLAVVIGVFVLCWFPFFFTYSLGAVCPKLCQVPNALFQFFFWIGYCNSSLNPVIYTIFNQDFRRAFRRILCRQWTATAW